MSRIVFFFKGKVRNNDVVIRVCFVVSRYIKNHDSRQKKTRLVIFFCVRNGPHMYVPFPTRTTEWQTRTHAHTYTEHTHIAYTHTS